MEAKGPDKIGLPVREETVRRLRELVDQCAYLTVLNYYYQVDTPITQVHFLVGNYDLAELAAFYVEQPKDRKKGAECMLRLIKGGLVKFGVGGLDLLGLNVNELSEAAVLLNTIPKDERCDVLYLPPVYLVRLLGNKWR